MRISSGSTSRTVTGASRLVASSQTGLGFDYYHHEVAVGSLRRVDRLQLRRHTHQRAGGLGMVPDRTRRRHRRLLVRGDRRQRNGIDGAAPDRCADGCRHASMCCCTRATSRTATPAGLATRPTRRSTTGSSTCMRRCCHSARSIRPKATTTAGRRTATASPTSTRLPCPANGASPAYPDHAERYYSFDYGRVHFVVLDTEFAFQDAARRAEQLSWLEVRPCRDRAAVEDRAVPSLAIFGGRRARIGSRSP